MKVSIYDLAYDFIEYALDPTVQLTDTLKKEVVHILQEVSGRVNAKFVQEQINKMSMAKCRDIYEFRKALMSRGNLEPNLLTTGRFYLHPELRCTAKPPSMAVDYESGQIIRNEEEYYLEMAYSYTFSELAAYYGSKKELIPPLFEMKRIDGALKYLLKRFDVEVLLFMIDRCYDDITTFEKEAPESPIVVENYYGLAKAAMDACISQVKEEGGDAVVKKRRVLSR